MTSTGRFPRTLHAPQSRRVRATFEGRSSSSELLPRLLDVHGKERKRRGRHPVDTRGPANRIGPHELELFGKLRGKAGHSAEDDRLGNANGPRAPYALGDPPLALDVPLELHDVGDDAPIAGWERLERRTV